MLVIRHDEVRDILRGAEQAVLELVRDTYREHDAGETVVPHSTFLRFPGESANRIIGLPAFVGGEQPIAGIKWVASFPGNLGRGLPRASATIVLNSMETGRPLALMEGAQISAARTAAATAVAAQTLAGPDPVRSISMIGCGLINFEVLRFLPGLSALTLFDVSRARAEAFGARARQALPALDVRIAATSAEAVAAAGVLSLATTAIEPHMTLDGARPGAVVLHISLRDLTPETVLAARNVVDDVDHVLRERTSVHLAELATGDRAFVHATLGGLLRGTTTLPGGGSSIIFSPFGLGALDLALARYVLEQALARNSGLAVEAFQQPV
ncbi:2,3-diaminopropionate biosynthesis protein SbnB [Nonomuraea sp. SBT364]|uniref:2,3-diaminopropionate biosynthesis protein SbnB n=1 Tax=Nonomuraea sp. SBT364 TaxID=1580530 RepID=UPI00066C03D5|nr:2,3-diaminopropionate biosynthesis protein SbnB [Nonomuraea sp. SBT364]